MTYDNFAESTVFVLGEALDLDAMYPSGTRVLRASPPDLDVGPAPISLLVLDARANPLSVLAHVRRSERFAKVPALVLTDDPSDPALFAVGGDDVLAEPFSRGATTRLRTLLDLGRTRLSLGAAQRALETASRGSGVHPRVRLPMPGDASAAPRIDETSSLEVARAEVQRLFALLVERQTFDQAILDDVDVGIITTDSLGRVTFVNRTARSVLGREGHLDGEDVCELLALPFGPDSILTRQLERRWPHTLRVLGREVELDLAVSRVQESASAHLGYFFIFHDRTEEKKLEMERRRFERLAAMGTMVAGFAHEVRNPMASLRSIAESLSEELIEANVKLPHIDRMLKVVERVERLVRTSLLFGRPSPPRAAAHRPSAILSAAVFALTPRTTALGRELIVESDLDLPDVFVDDGQLVQVLVILLNNALDAAASPRKVALRARYGRMIPESRLRKSEPPPPMLLRFEVTDDGPGIPADIIGRIFDPFFTTKASGTGLGLSIAQQLVTENGGRIELESQLGGPTTFSVIVPIVLTDTAPVTRR